MKRKLAERGPSVEEGGVAGLLRLPEGVGERGRGLLEGGRERRGLGNARVVVVVVVVGVVGLLKTNMPVPL